MLQRVSGNKNDVQYRGLISLHGSDRYYEKNLTQLCGWKLSNPPIPQKLTWTLYTLCEILQAAW